MYMYVVSYKYVLTMHCILAGQNYSQRMGFITTQTPLPNTVKDFWQMVWNFPCRVVVTLNEVVSRSS